jgi:hypothetical protein
VTVEIDPDCEPIRGIVSDDNTARSVTGWMQLVTCAQAAIDRQADDADIRSQNDATQAPLAHGEERIGESP